MVKFGAQKTPTNSRPIISVYKQQKVQQKSKVPLQQLGRNTVYVIKDNPN